MDHWTYLKMFNLIWPNISENDVQCFSFRYWYKKDHQLRCDNWTQWFTGFPIFQKKKIENKLTKNMRIWMRRLERVEKFVCFTRASSPTHNFMFLFRVSTYNQYVAFWPSSTYIHIHIDRHNVSHLSLSHLLIIRHIHTFTHCKSPSLYALKEGWTRRIDGWT